MTGLKFADDWERAAKEWAERERAAAERAKRLKPWATAGAVVVIVLSLVVALALVSAVGGVVGADRQAHVRWVSA